MLDIEVLELNRYFCDQTEKTLLDDCLRFNGISFGKNGRIFENPSKTL